MQTQLKAFKVFILFRKDREGGKTKRSTGQHKINRKIPTEQLKHRAIRSYIL